MAHFEKTPDGYTITNAGQTVWLTPEQAYGLLRWLYDRRDWQYIGALKAAMPALQEEYEAPSEERYQPVKVFSVKYDSLSQEALKLLNDLQIEMQFRDQAEM